MVNIQSHITSGTATTSQKVALHALQHGYPEQMLSDLTEKRALFRSLAAKLPMVRMFPSDGGFYSFWDVRKLFGKRTPDGTVIKSSDDVSTHLIESAGVVTLSGSAFKLEGYLRTCFFTEMDQISDGLSAAKEALGKLD